MVPVIQCLSADSLVVPWCVAPPDLMKSIIGPLYKVMTIAPITVIAVPMIFARLRIFFTLTFSNLIDIIIVYQTMINSFNLIYDIKKIENKISRSFIL